MSTNHYSQHVNMVPPFQWTHHGKRRRQYLSILSTSTEMSCPYVPWMCQIRISWTYLPLCALHNFYSSFHADYHLQFSIGVPRCLGKRCTGLPVHFSCLENRHKALFDEVLWSWCGENAGFCQFWKMKPVLLFVIHCRVKTQRSFKVS